MSEIYEGIVCKAEKEKIEEFLYSRQIREFNLKKVDNEILLILLTKNDVRSFSPNSEMVAKSLSLGFQKSLLFQYDSRVGYRASELFIDGEIKNIFGVEDELYMILDDDGEPDKNRGIIHYSEMLENEEYETSKNAIDIGLEHISSNLNWNVLREFINTS